MKKLLAIALLVMPSLAIGQDCRGVADCFQKSMRDQERYEQEKEMRRLQIERMRAGQAADPEIDRQLRESDAQRAASACRTEVYIINGDRMTCKVCPGQQITMTNCTR